MTAEPPSLLEPTSRLVTERPPDGLARGVYPWPLWAVGLFGAALVALALVYLWRTRRSRE
jgi:hypothetical protein